MQFWREGAISWQEIFRRPLRLTAAVLASLLILYEVIYKWSFCRAPFDENRPMPPAEVRDLIIQVGIAASFLTGFASGFLTFKKWTWVWLGVFV